MAQGENNRDIKKALFLQAETIMCFRSKRETQHRILMYSRTHTQVFVCILNTKLYNISCFFFQKREHISDK